jgi:hypothetical protein
MKGIVNIGWPSEKNYLHAHSYIIKEMKESTILLIFCSSKIPIQQQDAISH